MLLIFFQVFVIILITSTVDQHIRYKWQSDIKETKGTQKKTQYVKMRVLQDNLIHILHMEWNI